MGLAYHAEPPSSTDHGARCAVTGKKGFGRSPEETPRAITRSPTSSSHFSWVPSVPVPPGPRIGLSARSNFGRSTAGTAKGHPHMVAPTRQRSVFGHESGIIERTGGRWKPAKKSAQESEVHHAEPPRQRKESLPASAR